MTAAVLSFSCLSRRARDGRIPLAETTMQHTSDESLRSSSTVVVLVVLVVVIGSIGIRQVRR